MIKLTTNLNSDKEGPFSQMKEGVLYRDPFGLVYTRLQRDNILCLDHLTMSPLEEFPSDGSLTP